MKTAPTRHQTRFCDALARFSAIYKYAVLHIISELQSRRGWATGGRCRGGGGGGPTLKIKKQGKKHLFKKEIVN